MRNWILLLAATVALCYCPSSLAAVPDDERGSFEYLPELSGLPQGGVILRYPVVTTPIAARMAEVLREFGWSVLLVPISDLAYRGEWRASTTDDDIGELVNYMTQQKGQLNLVVMAMGDTWDDTINLARSEQDGASENPIRGVVLVDVPGPVSAPKDLPLLDVITTRTPVTGFKERRQSAKKQRLNEQLGLHLPYSRRRAGDEETFLTRRIRGWLYHHVKGMELASVARR